MPRKKQHKKMKPNITFYGCLFVAKFNDYISRVQHLTYIHSTTDCLDFSNNLLPFFEAYFK